MKSSKSDSDLLNLTNETPSELGGSGEPGDAKINLTEDFSPQKPQSYALAVNFTTDLDSSHEELSAILEKETSKIEPSPLSTTVNPSKREISDTLRMDVINEKSFFQGHSVLSPIPIRESRILPKPLAVKRSVSSDSFFDETEEGSINLTQDLSTVRSATVKPVNLFQSLSISNSDTSDLLGLDSKKQGHAEQYSIPVNVTEEHSVLAGSILDGSTLAAINRTLPDEKDKKAQVKDLSLLGTFSESTQDSSLLFGKPAIDADASASMALNLTVDVVDRHEEIINSFKKVADEILKLRNDLPEIKNFIRNLNKELSISIETLEKLFNELIVLRASIYVTPAPANSNQLKLLVVQLLILIHIITKNKEIEINNKFYQNNYELVKNIENLVAIESISDEKIAFFDQLFLIETTYAKIEKLFDDKDLQTNDFVNKAKIYVQRTFENIYLNPEKFEPNNFYNFVSNLLSSYKTNVKIFREFSNYIQKLPENIQTIYKKIYEPLKKKAKTLLAQIFTKEEIDPSKIQEFNQFAERVFSLLKDVVKQFNALLPDIKEIVGTKLENSVAISDTVAKFVEEKIDICVGISGMIAKLISENDSVLEQLEKNILEKVEKFCDQFKSKMDNTIEIKNRFNQIIEELLHVITSTLDRIQSENFKSTVVALVQKFIEQLQAETLYQFEEALCDTEKQQAFEKKVEKGIAQIEQHRYLYLQMIKQFNECNQLILDETNAEKIESLCPESDINHPLTQALVRSVQALRDNSIHLIWQTFVPILENPQQFTDFNLEQFKIQILQPIKHYLERCSVILNSYSNFAKISFNIYSEKFTALKQSTDQHFCDHIDQVWQNCSITANQILVRAYTAAYQDLNYIENLNLVNKKIRECFENGYCHLCAEKRKTVTWKEFYQILTKIPETFKKLAEKNWNQFFNDNLSLEVEQFEIIRQYYFDKVNEIIIAYNEVNETLRNFYKTINEQYGSHQQLFYEITRFNSMMNERVEEFFQLAFANHANFDRAYNDDSILNDTSIHDEAGNRTMTQNPNYLETVKQAIERFIEEMNKQLVKNDSSYNDTEDERRDFEEELSDDLTEEMEEPFSVTAATQLATLDVMEPDENAKGNLKKLNKQVISTAIILKRLEKKHYSVVDWRENSTNAEQILDAEKAEHERVEKEALINIFTNLDADFVRCFGSNPPAAICLFLLIFPRDKAYRCFKGEENFNFMENAVKSAIENIETIKRDIYENQYVENKVEKQKCIIRFWQLMKLLNNQQQEPDNRNYQIHQALVIENLSLAKDQALEKDVIEPQVTNDQVTTLDKIYKIQKQQEVTESNINQIDLLVTKYDKAQDKKLELQDLKTDYKQVSDTYYASRYADPNQIEDRETFNQGVITKLNEHLKKQNHGAANHNNMTLDKHTGVKPYLYGLVSAVTAMSVVTLTAAIIYAVCRWINIKNYNSKIEDQAKHKKFTFDFFPKAQTQREIEIEKITNDITTAPAA